MKYKSFKVRIYPSFKQQELINKTLGSCRFIYNSMLYERNKVYENLKDNKRDLYEYNYKTEKQYKAEFEWLKEVDSIALQQARIDLSHAYTNFFNSLKKVRKGEQVGFPKYKKKKGKNSYRTMNNNNALRIDFDNRKILIPTLRWVKFKDKRKEVTGKVKSATISRTSTGKYFVSVIIEEEWEPQEIVLSDTSKDKIIGLDMSLEKFFVDNNGNSPAYERLYRKYEKKLARVSRKISRRKKGSNNWYKANLERNKIYETIANRRNDFTQKLSTQLIKDYDIIVVESLSIKGMSQALKLGKSIMDLGYSSFIHQLQYKTYWNNKTLIQADKWFASSKTCSICGYKNTDLLLSDRTWTCPNCGKEHDRDQNAGQNLKQYAINLIGLP